MPTRIRTKPSCLMVSQLRTLAISGTSVLSEAGSILPVPHSFACNLIFSRVVKYLRAKSRVYQAWIQSILLYGCETLPVRVNAEIACLRQSCECDLEANQICWTRRWRKNWNPSLDRKPSTNSKGEGIEWKPPVTSQINFTSEVPLVNSIRDATPGECHRLQIGVVK